jgi:hypothetical protein
MFEVTNIFRRHDVNTPWFRESSPENEALNDAYGDEEARADGYRGRVEDSSKNVKRYVVSILWRDQEAADRFAVQAAVTFAVFLETRAAYYAANGIRHQVFPSYVSDADPAPVVVALEAETVKKKRAKSP